MKKKIIIVLIITIVVMFVPIVSYADQNNPKNIEPFNPVDEYEEIEKTAEGVTEFKEEVLDELDEISKSKLSDIFTTVTFVRPISFDELKIFVAKYNISVDVIEARYVKNYDRYTTAIICDGTLTNAEKETFLVSDNMGAVDLSENEINYTDIVEGDVNNVGNIEVLPVAIFLGYIDIYAKIDAKYLELLANDELVYLPDISGDAATEGKTIKDGDKRNEYRFDDGIDDYPQSLSWLIEDIGFENLEIEELDRGLL
jgi:hypothetical protein